MSNLSLFEVLTRYQDEVVSLEIAPLHPDGYDKASHVPIRTRASQCEALFDNVIYFGTVMTWLDLAHDVAKNVSDCRTKQRQDNDYHNSYQNKNQRILNQTLSLFTR